MGFGFFHNFTNRHAGFYIRIDIWIDKLVDSHHTCDLSTDPTGKGEIHPLWSCSIRRNKIKNSLSERWLSG